MPPKKTTAPTTPTRKPKPLAKLPSLSYHHPPPPWVNKSASRFWWSTAHQPGHSNYAAIQKPVVPEEVHKPDVFYGSNTCKLQPFLVQCTLNFHNHPDTFTSDSDKVTFALSYLKGTTLDWFKLSLTSGKSLPWLNNYSNFIRELKNNFKPNDPKGKAEANLKNLKLYDNQCIMKYLVDFNYLDHK